MRLDARHMTVRAGGCRVIDDVSAHLETGELVGLIGPNGAGKSTLLRAMLGLLPHSDGAVTLDGQSLRHLPAHERARRIAYLPQDGRVDWGLDGRTVTMLGRYPYRRAFGGPTPACREAVDAALAAVDATALAARSFAVMSGGERARVLLARALCLQAPFLLADEPVAALDPRHQMRVMDLLRGAARGGTGVLVVLHDLTLASRFMDRLILMHRGRVVAEGPPDAVLTAETVESVYRVSTVTAGDGPDRAVLPWAASDPD